MGSIYYVRQGITFTDATANDALVQIWNPSATRVIRVLELVAILRVAGTEGQGWQLRRSTARGTPAITLTPTADHDRRGKAAPESGFVIDTAVFSVEPTLAAGTLSPAWVTAVPASSGVLAPLPHGIDIPPGTGLVLVNRAAIAHQSTHFSVVVEEP